MLSIYTVLHLIFFPNLTMYPGEFCINITKLMNSFKELHQMYSMDMLFLFSIIILLLNFTIINDRARISLYMSFYRWASIAKG